MEISKKIIRILIVGFVAGISLAMVGYVMFP
jgi:hypothetical protein